MPIRTMSIPVAEVVEGGTKEEFYADLRDSLVWACRMANMAVSDCMKNETHDDAKIKVYSYPAIKHMANGIASELAAITRAIDMDWQRSRRRITTGAQSTRNYRSHPWPLLKQSGFKIDGSSEQFLTATVKLKGKRWTVRLMGGSNYRDQIRAVRQAAVSGNVRDSRIRMVKKGKKRIAALDISCEIPARTRDNLSGTMQVTTCVDAFLKCAVPRSTVPFVISGNDIHEFQRKQNVEAGAIRKSVQGIVGRSQQLQDIAKVDRKAGVDKHALRKRMNQLSLKRDRRLKTYCHEASKHVVDKAVRLRIQTISLDFTVKSFCKQFPWAFLKEKIAYKAASAGIVVIDHTESIVEPSIYKPHVYFAYDPGNDLIKIGCTARDDGERFEEHKTANPNLVLLAVDCIDEGELTDNQIKAKVLKLEKQHLSKWRADRHKKAKGQVRGQEVFKPENIIAWLNAKKWLGNAGNLAEIRQVLRSERLGGVKAAEPARV